MAINFESIADEHGFSADAVRAACNAIQHGNGRMAQFSHPELGGGGQWMPGMLMIGDMFNTNLKSRVDRLFHDLHDVCLDAPESAVPGHGKSASHDDSRQASVRYAATEPSNRAWYPAELGHPSSAGSQNNVRYAYFGGPRRLAIDLSGKVSIYDTGPHVISGVQQGQSNDVGSITFTSQLGVIPLTNLQTVG